MPTDETPSAGAVAMATRYFNGAFPTLADCLDVFARERETAVWSTVWPAIGKLEEALRAAEERGKG